MPTEWHESYADRVEGLPPSILRDLEKRCRTKGRGRVEPVPADTPLDGLEHPRIEQAVNDVVSAYARKKERSARDAAKKRQSLRAADVPSDVPSATETGAVVDPEPPSLEPLSISVPPASVASRVDTDVPPDLTCHETIESAAGHFEEEDASEAETDTECHEDMPARTMSAAVPDVPSDVPSASTSRRERVGGIFRVGTAHSADEKKAEPSTRHECQSRSRSSIFAGRA
jgi:hypothetical protein